MQRSESYFGDNLSALPDDAKFGVYIVRSDYDKRLYRIGAAGFKGSLIARLRHHAGPRPRSAKNPPNWTQLYRPWRPVWVAHLTTASAGSTLCCERYIQAKLSLHARFVDESGFIADLLDEEDVVALAESIAPDLEMVLSKQTAKFFPKLPKSGERWIAANHTEPDYG